MYKQFAYQQRAVTPTSIWLLFLFLGWSYGSMGQAVNNTLVQKRILYKDLQKRSNENTGYYKGKPFTGIVIAADGDGAPFGSIFQTNYINGKPDGLRIEYYTNGMIKKEEYIKQKGVYATSGWSEFNVGIKKEYSINGDKVLIEEYFPDGKLKYSQDFSFGHWYEDLNTGKRFQIPNSTTIYLSNGIYEVRATHKSTENLKEIYKFNSLVKDYYGNSSKFGICQTFFENGKIQQEGNIKLNYTKGNNFMVDHWIGVWKFYYDNGQLESTGLYSISKWTNTSHKDKEWKYFYENGVLKEKGSYKAEEIDKDFKVGKWQEFYENGKLKTISNYLNNKLEGDYIEYDENGRVISKEKYWDGKKIE
jgi:antitoxin component YwqK of YwqJK toxin-antitoxin module